MKPKDLPYSEGTVFTLPLKTKGWMALGVVARMAPRGRVLFGYFFGPAFHVNEQPDLTSLAPSEAILVKRFGDLGLIAGTWKPIGRVPEWDRARWAMPVFVRPDPFGNKAPRVIRYSDMNPNQQLTITVAAGEQTEPVDGLAGAEYIEIVLTKILIQ